MPREQSPVEVHKAEEILEELQDKTAEELLIEILLELKKLNIQAILITDTEIEETE